MDWLTFLLAIGLLITIGGVSAMMRVRGTRTRKTRIEDGSVTGAPRVVAQTGGPPALSSAGRVRQLRVNRRYNFAC